MVVGPIHRFQNFERQATRRRWDAADFFSGAERLLIGAFMAYVLARLVSGEARGLDQLLMPCGSFITSWGGSALSWVVLYFSFAGMTAMALGIALMMGIRLEENFDAPWRAGSLLEFWKRWHMTLSNWVLDYVFRPILAITRSPLAGLVAAMLAIGLWHEFSLYYVLWSGWQVAGVVLTRLAGRYAPGMRLRGMARAIVAPVAILGWLSLARPVIELVIGRAA